MDLKIEFDHTKPTNAERLGTTNERHEEIKELVDYAINNEIEVSKALEWILRQLKDVGPCDLLMVGLIFNWELNNQERHAH